MCNIFYYYFGHAQKVGCELEVSYWQIKQPKSDGSDSSSNRDGIQLMLELDCLLFSKDHSITMVPFWLAVVEIDISRPPLIRRFGPSSSHVSL
jgi:hypothetical protein